MFQIKNNFTKNLNYKNTDYSRYFKFFFKYTGSQKSSHRSSNLAMRSYYMADFLKNTVFPKNLNFIHSRFIKFFTKHRLIALFQKNYVDGVLLFKTKSKLNQSSTGYNSKPIPLFSDLRKIIFNQSSRQKLFQSPTYNYNPRHKRDAGRVDILSSSTELIDKKLVLISKQIVTGNKFAKIGQSLVHRKASIRLLIRKYVPFYRSKKKKLAKINSFNKIWHRLFFRKFFEGFGFFKNTYYKFIQKTMQLLNPKSIELKSRTGGFYDFFYQNINLTVFNFLRFELCIKHISLVLFLISSGLVSINGIVVNDPLTKIPYNSIIRLNMSPSFFFSIVFTSNRFLNFNTKLIRFKSFFKVFKLSQNVIGNFNLLEFFVMREVGGHNRKLTKEGLFNSLFKIEHMLYQYFFVKQRRLRAGR